MKIGKYKIKFQFNPAAWALPLAVDLWYNIFRIQVLCFAIEIWNGEYGI